MRLLPLGVGDAFSALHYTSSVLLESGGQWLLLDCPHPIRKILREGSQRALGRPLDLADLAGVAVTHLHADHSAAWRSSASTPTSCSAGAFPCSSIPTWARGSGSGWRPGWSASSRWTGRCCATRSTPTSRWCRSTRRAASRLGPFEVECRRPGTPSRPPRYACGPEAAPSRTARTRARPRPHRLAAPGRPRAPRDGARHPHAPEDLEALPAEAGPHAAHPLPRRAAPGRPRSPACGRESCMTSSGDEWSPLPDNDAPEDRSTHDPTGFPMNGLAVTPPAAGADAPRTRGPCRRRRPWR